MANLKGLLMMALVGAMAIPRAVMESLRYQPGKEAYEPPPPHFHSGRSHEEKCAARRTYPSLHPKHIDRHRGRYDDTFWFAAPSDKRDPRNMSRSAPPGYRWEFGRLVPRNLPPIRRHA